MNEHGYIRSVNPHVGGSYHWKIHDSYESGVPDCFYEGDANDLWIEYKFIKPFPKKPTTVIDLTNTDRYLSKKQQEWLKRRHRQRGDAWVIAGSLHGGVIFRGLGWQKPITAAEFLERALAPRQIAAIITAYINGKE